MYVSAPQPVQAVPSAQAMRALPALEHLAPSRQMPLRQLLHSAQRSPLKSHVIPQLKKKYPRGRGCTRVRIGLEAAFH